MAWHSVLDHQTRELVWVNKLTGERRREAPTSTAAARGRATDEQASVVQNAADQGLPPGWDQAHDAQGRVYYFNKELNTSQWEKPQTPAATAKAAQDVGAGGEGSVWTEYFDETHQRPYWCNASTGESSWTDPTAAVAQEVKAAEDVDQELQRRLEALKAPPAKCASHSSGLGSDEQSGAGVGSGA